MTISLGLLGIVYPDGFVETSPYTSTSQAIFAYGSIGSGMLVSNLVSNTGLVSTDITITSSKHEFGACAGYGGDKAIFGYGYDNGPSVSYTNLISNIGVVGADVTGVGTARNFLAAAIYGGDKAIFAYGATGTTTHSLSNLVSNIGVVATDVTGVGTARQALAAAGYGGDKAIFGYGNKVVSSVYTYYSLTNLVSNTGTVATDVTGVGTSRRNLAATGYGGDKAIFGYGDANAIRNPSLSMTNLVSNVGVVSTDVTGVGTLRSNPVAAIYAGDKAIFAYGISLGSTMVAFRNLISNIGVVATDVACAGSARQGAGGAGYGA